MLQCTVSHTGADILSATHQNVRINPDQMFPVQGGYDTSVCCCTLGLLFACQRSLLDDFFLSLEMHVSIWLLKFSDPQNVPLVLIDTRVVSLKPPRVYLMMMKVGPPSVRGFVMFNFLSVCYMMMLYIILGLF